jgi:predicted HTH transcriptional regulator
MKLVYSGKREKPRSLEDLKKTLRRGEGLHLEFKFKIKYPEKVVKEIVAFANTDGGQLMIGIDDNGTISGLKYTDEEEFVLIREMERSIIPLVTYSIERIQLTNDKEVLIFHIPESENKPHKLENGAIYVRHKDQSIQASKEIREILKGIRKDKDLRFNYGDKERLLMEYLNNNTTITLSKFAEIAKINRKIASRTIVLMTLTNVLNYEAREDEDIFFLN